MPDEKSFTCPECDSEVTIQIDSWGSPGTAPRNWDPGDPGDPVEWSWPDPRIPGCPASVFEGCVFWPKDTIWGVELVTEWRGVRQESGVTRFQQFMEDKVEELLREHIDNIASDAADRAYDDWKDREWDRGEARRWGGVDKP